MFQVTEKKPYGYCDKCNYEFNSELLNEYAFTYCPYCGEPLGEGWINPPSEAGRLACDRCGKVMANWELPGDTDVIGGNCSLCGDDLCSECAEAWTDGVCRRCVEDAITFYARVKAFKDEAKLTWDEIDARIIKEVI